MKNATLQIVLGEGCRVCILLWVCLHCCILLLSYKIAESVAMLRKHFRWRVQHCRLSLRKDAGFAFFFEYLCIVAFFFCLAKLQNQLLCGESISDEECNIAGCLWGRMQGLHSSFECICIVAFFFFCPMLRPVTRFLTEWVMLNRQKKKNQPAKINHVKS